MPITSMVLYVSLDNPKITVQSVGLRYPGHLNDATTYRLLPGIGNNRQRNLPRQACLFADGGYTGQVPLITPRRQLVRNRRVQRANRELRRLRVQIEHGLKSTDQCQVSSDRNENFRCL